MKISRKSWPYRFVLVTWFTNDDGYQDDWQMPKGVCTFFWAVLGTAVYWVLAGWWLWLAFTGCSWINKTLCKDIDYD